MAAVLLLVLSSIVGAITLMAVGGNDVANSQATAVGSGALSLRGAYIVAGICEWLGSSLMGSNVSSTLGDEFIDHYGNISDKKYCWGMFCSLVSAAVWIFICTAIKMPVSTTHSIIGALIGFELIVTNFNPTLLNYQIILEVVLAWVVSPLLGLILAYVFMLSLSKFWIDINAKLRTLSMPLLGNDEQNANNTTENNIDLYNNNNNNKDGKATNSEKNGDNAEKNEEDANMTVLSAGSSAFETTVPIKNGGNGDEYGTMGDSDLTSKKESDILTVNQPKAVKFGILFGIVMTVITLFIFVGGPPDVRITELVDWWIIIIIGIGVFIITAIIGYFLEKPYHRYYYRRNHSFMTEDYFIIFLIIASGAVSFAHGGNDVANVIGPFGAIWTYSKYGDLASHSFEVPLWLSMSAGICIVIGFILFGKSVMETIGNKITKLTYRSGFAAQFAAALTVLVCNVFGIPVSSTTVIVGSVAGVGIYSRPSESERKDTITSKKMSVAETGTRNITYFIEKLKKMNFKVLGKILLTWIVTIPTNAFLCAVIFLIVDQFI